MKKCCLLLLLAFVARLLPAQDKLTVEGTVLDVNGQPVPWAYVRFKEQVFTLTDLDGRFLLSLPGKRLHDTLTVSAMGFITYHAPLSQYQPRQPITIHLQPENFLLDPVTVSGNQARRHWLKALQQLQAQLPRTAYTYPAFYRQTHRENGAYVRLIEAGMTVYDPVATYHAGVMQERFRLEQVRRSDVLERNGDEHGDHLVDMFMENCLRYPMGTIMDTKALPLFDVKFDYAACTFCGDSLEMLAYRYERPQEPKMLEGKIWLYVADKRLFALEETATQNPKFIEKGIAISGGNHHWMFQESQKTLRFGYVDGSIYLAQLDFQYLHHIQDRSVGMVRYEVAEGFALVCGLPTLHRGGFVPDKNFARSGNLYSRKYRYEPQFWERFSLAERHPLPLSVAQALNNRFSLQEQFRRNGE